MIKRLLKVIASGVIALALLSVISVCWSYTGTHVENDTGATDYTRESGQLIVNMNEGMAIQRMDDNGFNNLPEVAAASDNIDNLLMGSSHMEAQQLPMDESMGALMNDFIEDEVTYNIGLSAHNIYRVFSNLERAIEVYHPKNRVIIETGTCHLDVDSMMSVLEGTYPKRKSYDSGLLYLISKYVPYSKRFFLALRNWRRADTDYYTRSKADIPEERYDEVLDSFIAYAADIAKHEDLALIIFYHPELNVSPDGVLRRSENERYIRAFADVCRRHGIAFVDMEEDFISLYENENKLAHGFMNSGVGVGHLNSYGHRVCADKIARMILRGEV